MYACAKFTPDCSSLAAVYLTLNPLACSPDNCYLWNDVTTFLHVMPLHKINKYKATTYIVINKIFYQQKHVVHCTRSIAVVTSVFIVQLRSPGLVALPDGAKEIRLPFLPLCVRSSSVSVGLVGLGGGAELIGLLFWRRRQCSSSVSVELLQLFIQSIICAAEIHVRNHLDYNYSFQC